jgi:hypothetical protein
LLFQKLRLIPARLFDNQAVRDNRRAQASPAHSSKGRSAQPIENAQNQEEYSWENLEKLGKCLEICSLQMNKINGLTKPACAAFVHFRGFSRRPWRSLLSPTGCLVGSYFPPRFEPKSRLAPNRAKILILDKGCSCEFGKY